MEPNPTNPTSPVPPRRPLRVGRGTAAVAALAVAALAGAGAVELAQSGGASPAVDAASIPVASASPSLAAATSGSPLAQFYRRTAPGVVSITVTSTATSNAPFAPSNGTQTAQGSGFVLDTKGDVLTNEHVIDGANSIRVTFADGSTVRAHLVGKDAASDLAVIKADAPVSQLHPLTLGSSSALAVGDTVAAIGNPFGYAGTFTAGIVSAKGRSIEAPNGFTISDAIQTDAAINHGNSGGPLLDSKGRVVGIAAQIADSGVDANVGVGFAIPVDTAKRVISALESGKAVTHAWLGISGQTLDPDVAQQAGVTGVGNGVLITGVVSGSPADKAGIKGLGASATGACTAGDVLTAVDGSSLTSIEQLQRTIEAHGTGDVLRFTVRHADGSSSTVSVTLGAQPSSAPSAASATCGG